MEPKYHTKQVGGVINQSPKTQVPACRSGSTGFMHSEPTGPVGSEVLSSPLPVFSSMVLFHTTLSCPDESYCSVKTCGLPLNFPVFTPSLLKGAMNFNMAEAMIGRQGVA